MPRGRTKNRIWFCKILSMGLVLILTNSCLKSDPEQLPVVLTTEVTNLWPANVRISGKITSNGGSRLSEQGFCLSEEHLPDISDNKIKTGFRCICPYSIMVTGLSPQTDYYVRAYATNSNGTAYGAELPFTTPADHTGEKGTVEDSDGNVCQTIGIGAQIWMAENLKTTRYSNGDPIGTTIPATMELPEDLTHKYQWAYGGDESNVAAYGRLYTWDAATDSRNVCPAGWHVFSNDDWSTLLIFLGESDDTGGKLKEEGTTHWQSPNTGATNETGFSALPGGGRDGKGAFYGLGYGGFWWSSSESTTTLAFYRALNHDSGTIYNYSIYKYYGLSVRCLKNP